MFVRFVLVAVIALALAWSVLARSAEGTGVGQPYRVKPGDTLWSISVAHYRGDPRQGVWQIQRKNGLESATLVPGQTVVLP